MYSCFSYLNIQNNVDEQNILQKSFGKAKKNIVENGTDDV